MNAPEGSEPMYTDADQPLWVNERHSENSCLLLEKIDDEEADAYTVTVVAEGLLAQEVSLQVGNVESIAELTEQIIAGVPTLAGATDVKLLYFEPDFEEFVVLSDANVDELPAELKIKADGTPAPTS